MKKFLCVVLTLVLVLSALAGCARKYDPQMKGGSSEDSQSEPESSQSESKPEPVAPEPIMPVPASEPEPEPEPESEPAPEEDEDDGEEDGEDADGEDEEGEEDEEEEEDGHLPPKVPHGDELSWLDLSTVTVDELRPVLEQVLDRAEYFCRLGLAGKYTEAGPDSRKEVAITRKYKSSDKWTYYPYTELPYQNLEELEEDILTTFSWGARQTELSYLFEILTDDGERLYYADDLVGYSKARAWDTSKMVIEEASAKKLVVHMPATWQNKTFDADLTLQLWDGYLVVGEDYFAISAEDKAKQESHGH